GRRQAEGAQPAPAHRGAHAVVPRGATDRRPERSRHHLPAPARRIHGEAVRPATLRTSARSDHVRGGASLARARRRRSGPSLAARTHPGRRREPDPRLGTPTWHSSNVLIPPRSLTETSARSFRESIS